MKKRDTFEDIAQEKKAEHEHFRSNRFYNEDLMEKTA
jgi:hypothetical protein